VKINSRKSGYVAPQINKAKEDWNRIKRDIIVPNGAKRKKTLGAAGTGKLVS